MKLLLVLLASMTVMACSHYGKKHHDGDVKAMHDHHKQMWTGMDTDKDGMVSKKEFDTAHADKFKKMDANKDGKVSDEEHMSHHNEMMKNHGCEKCGSKKKCDKC